MARRSPARRCEELTFRTIYTARNAAMQIQAHGLGHVSPLNAEETTLAGEYNLRPGPVARAWEYWSVRLDKAEGNWRPAKPKLVTKSPRRRRNVLQSRRKLAKRESQAMTSPGAVRGMIAVDKIGCKILFLNPQTYETETVIDGFQRTVHELLVIPETGLAYVPIFGDGIHGRNPNPGHVLHVIDLLKRKHVGDIDLSPYSAPHTVRLGADGLIYITCENSAVVAVIDPKTHKMIDAIDSGSTNGHRLAIAPDGQRLYTDNEEDATVSVIDVPNRKLLGKIKTPQALAGIAVSGDGRTVVAVSDEPPVVFLIDTAAGSVTREVRLEGVPKAGADRALFARRQPRRRQQPEQQHGELDRLVIRRADRGPGRQRADGLRISRRRTVRRLPGRRIDPRHRYSEAAAQKALRAGIGCESVGFF